GGGRPQLVSHRLETEQVALGDEPAACLDTAEILHPEPAVLADGVDHTGKVMAVVDARRLAEVLDEPGFIEAVAVAGAAHEGEGGFEGQSVSHLMQCDRIEVARL